jgi:TonB family protein
MNYLIVAALFFSLRLASVQSPVYPSDAYRGGTVVAVLKCANGSVTGIDVLWGEEPFLSSSKSALKQWQFDPDQKDPVLVVVQFRHPDLDFPVTNKATVPQRKAPVGLPYPKKVIQPNYPLFAEGGGSVIIRAEITASGRISDTKVIQPLGVLTNTALDALKQWEFVPARNSSGAAVPSRVYAVMVFREPVIAPEEK